MALDNIFWSQFFRRLREWWYRGHESVPTISFPLEATGISRPTVFNSAPWVDEFLAFLTIPRPGLISATAHDDTISLNIFVPLSTGLLSPITSLNNTSPLLQFEKVAAPAIEPPTINPSRTIPVDFDGKPENTAIQTTDLVVYTEPDAIDTGFEYACNWQFRTTGTWLDKVNNYIRPYNVPVGRCTYDDGSYKYQFDTSLVQTWIALLVLLIMLSLAFCCSKVSATRRPRTHRSIQLDRPVLITKFDLWKLMANIALLRGRLDVRNRDVEALTNVNEIQRDAHGRQIREKEAAISAKNQMLQFKDLQLSEKDNLLNRSNEEVAGLKNNVEQLERQVKGYEGSKALRDRYDELQKTHTELLAREKSLLAQIENQPDADEELRKENEKLHKEKEKLQERLKHKAEALQGAQAALEKKEETAPEQNKAIMSQTETDKARTAELEQLNSSNAQLPSELNQMRSTNSELQSTIPTLRAQTSQPSAQSTRSMSAGSLSTESSRSLLPQDTVYGSSRPATGTSISNVEQHFAQTCSPVEAGIPLATAPSVFSRDIFSQETAPDFAQTSSPFMTDSPAGPLIVRLASTDTSTGPAPTTREESLLRPRHGIRYGSPPRNAAGIPTRPLTQREREEKRQRDAEARATTTAAAPSEAVAPGASSNGAVVALPAVTTDPAGSDADSGRQESQRSVEEEEEEEDDDDLEFAPGGFGEDDYPEGVVGGDADTGRQESIDSTESGQGADSVSSAGHAAVEMETTTPQEQPVEDNAERVAQKAKAGEEGRAALTKSRWAVKEE